MKFFFTYLFFLGICTQIHAQSGSVSASSTISPDGVALPRLTTTQRNNIILPAKGLSIFNVDANQVDVYDGTQWKSTISAASGTFILNDKNIGFGTGVLNAITSGKENVALGTNALIKNTVGINNVSIGSLSLMENTSGYGNVGVGAFALIKNIIGVYNTALGTGSLNASTTGDFNVAVGYQASVYNLDGRHNVAIGTNAGYNNIHGSNNIFIGAYSLGSSSVVSNEITLGDSQISALRCNVQSITSLSDARDKKNIQDLAVGLDFINSLKPRQFNWDKREWYENNKSDGGKVEKQSTAGFIAQELDEAQQQYNLNWLKLVYKSNPEKWEATYGNLLPVIVKAIQELSRKEEKLVEKEKLLNDKVDRLMTLEVRFEKLEQAMKNNIIK